MTAIAPLPEGLSARENIAYLNSFGYHERRLGMVAIVMAHPESPFTAQELAAETKGRQGLPTVWDPNPETPFNYAHQALVPLSAATRIWAPSNAGRHETARALQAHPHNATNILGFCGAVMDWTLNQSRLSLSQVWGTRAGLHRLRYPEIRYGIFRVLLDHPDAGQHLDSLYEQAAPAGCPPQIFAHQVGRLSAVGILRTGMHVRGRVGVFRDIHITPEHSKPIQEFFVRLRTLGHTAAVETFAAAARDTIGRPESFRQLVSKGERSRSADATRPALMTEFRAAHAESGVLDRQRLILFMNCFGAHEVKLLTAALLASRPGAVITAREMRNELVQRQGAEPVWDMDDTTAITYCARSFVPAGIAELTETMSRLGRMTQAAQGLESSAKQVLTFCGALLSWSIDYSEISLQELLGKRANKQTVRAPELRLAILRRLLANPEAEVMQADLLKQLRQSGHRTDNIRGHLRRLTDLGILASQMHQPPHVGAEIPKSFSLQDSYEEPIADLLERLDQLALPEEAADYGELALRILNTPSLVYDLMEKAMLASSARKNVMSRTQQLLQDDLMGIIDDTGSITVEEAVRSLAGSRQYPHSRTSITKALQTLVQSGTLHSKRIPAGPSWRTRVLQYRRAARPITEQ